MKLTVLCQKDGECLLFQVRLPSVCWHSNLRTFSIAKGNSTSFRLAVMVMCSWTFSSFPLTMTKRTSGVDNAFITSFKIKSHGWIIICKYLIILIEFSCQCFDDQLFLLVQRKYDFFKCFHFNECVVKQHLNTFGIRSTRNSLWPF